MLYRSTVSQYSFAVPFCRTVLPDVATHQCRMHAPDCCGELGANRGLCLSPDAWYCGSVRRFFGDVSLVTESLRDFFQQGQM